MEQVLASSLSGYSVMTTTGAELGVVNNVTADLQTGKLEYFRIDLNGNNTSGFRETDDGHVLVPADAVSEKSDYLLVEPATD
ncbi:PRC-barrel domain-containing protein [Halorubrum distributum]|uniref:PRC-barrel domain-containing protein n=1 Tax=Halorubrum distributum JCM 10247 TaxID=1227486 RepID=M0DPR2_9EURY|nr:PRC-barrel domain-containing protein [Halorubrum terrestre]ELZ36682.1 PRC-barrel domain-containing protein [Halorubrum terrestre JCM 10247]